MANSLLITKLSDDSFSFVVNGDVVNVIINLRNDMLSYGTECHFKTSEGSNLIKLQQLQYNQVTIVDGTTLPVATSPIDLRVKLRSVGFWDWMDAGGGTGVDAYQDLIDTEPFFGNDGKVPVVDEAEVKLKYIALPDVTYLNLFPSPLQPLQSIRVNAAGTAYEFYPTVNIVTQTILSGNTATAPSEDAVFQALATLAGSVSSTLPPGIEFTAVGGETSYDMGNTAIARMFFWNGVPQSFTQWSQIGSVISFAFPMNVGDFNQFI